MFELTENPDQIDCFFASTYEFTDSDKHTVKATDVYREYKNYCRGIKEEPYFEDLFSFVNELIAREFNIKDGTLTGFVLIELEIRNLIKNW